MQEGSGKDRIIEAPALYDAGEEAFNRVLNARDVRDLSNETLRSARFVTSIHLLGRPHELQHKRMSGLSTRAATTGEYNPNRQAIEFRFICPETETGGGSMTQSSGQNIIRPVERL
jgi:hypothetical protein